MLNGVVDIAGGMVVVGRVFFVVRGVLVLPLGIVAVCRWLISETWVLWVVRVCLSLCLCDLVMFLVFFLGVCLSVRVRL